MIHPVGMFLLPVRRRTLLLCSTRRNRFPTWDLRPYVNAIQECVLRGAQTRSCHLRSRQGRLSVMSIEGLQSAVAQLPAKSLTASRGGSRSSWPGSGIGKSRPTSWPGAWPPPVAAPTRSSRPAAARHCPREPLRHAGVLVPLSPLAAGDTGVGWTGASRCFRPTRAIRPCGSRGSGPSGRLGVETGTRLLAVSPFLLH